MTHPQGNLEDQLAAPLVTADGQPVGDIDTAGVDDKGLWPWSGGTGRAGPPWCRS
jgi:hypothetical protein